MSNRRLTITVSREEYQRLAQEARALVRSPEQQAAFIVRQHVSALCPAPIGFPGLPGHEQEA